jgi:hypothetical protein
MNNKSWNLEAFLDSLIVELDRARDTLAVKGVNKPLTYTVQDVALDLQIFPSYDGNQIRFLTAQPGDSGTPTKMSIKLGSITDQQIRVTTRKPLSKDDIPIENIKELDDESKKSLQKMGVSSAGDLKKMEERNIDIQQVSDNKLDYKQLSGLIEKARRGKAPPSVRNISFGKSDEGKPTLIIEGSNLSVYPKIEPVAVINNRLATVMSFDNTNVTIGLDNLSLQNGNNELIMTLDPFAIFKLKINNA